MINIQMVNSLDKKIMKKINDVVKFAQTAEYKIIQQDVLEKYFKVLELNGDEAALNALDNTLKSFKQKAKEKEKVMWTEVKSEIFNKNGFTPTSTRDLKAMIKSGQINFTGIESQEWVEKQLGLISAV